MYENETADAIRQRMLQRVPASIDKREGSVIYDAAAPAAIELELLYATLDFFLKATFADTAPREFLVERAKREAWSPIRRVLLLSKSLPRRHLLCCLSGPDFPATM